MNADSIRIESDERGFEMYLRVDEEPEVDENGWFRVNVHACALQLLREAQTNIGPWAAEAESVKRVFDRERDSYDPREAYEISDPKHPDFHSVHADIWDAREKGLL